MSSLDSGDKVNVSLFILFVIKEKIKHKPPHPNLICHQTTILERKQTNKNIILANLAERDLKQITAFVLHSIELNHLQVGIVLSRNFRVTVFIL